MLVKPQFEVGPKLVGKKGVVRDAKTHVEALLSCSTYEAIRPFSCVSNIFAYNRASGQHRVFGSLKPGEHWSETVSDSDVEQCVAAVHRDLLGSQGV